MSTMTTYTQYIRWSDVLEHDVTQQAQENWEPVSVSSKDQDKGKTVFHRIARAAVNYLQDVTEHLHRARKENAHQVGYYYW
ncbi:hypothetical protein [Alcaligenes endophyticus]|uniref:Uncharacterized protein n=1 Tax=Alcaligenes endophyticus TaxID=1929088 RepID=A0ABT8EGE4_9BURK|nr:hypothetical protein [Alcaligenes endophyticus]MCX5590065.1 hypothetical protein [Alcaligenes endophyticus]MDN4120272.1 hypothetical protein [Alcaligenes endophyticus]